MDHFRVGGRNGRFWVGLERSRVSRHRGAVDPQFVREPSRRRKSGRAQILRFVKPAESGSRLHSARKSVGFDDREPWWAPYSAAGQAIEHSGRGRHRPPAKQTNNRPPAWRPGSLPAPDAHDPVQHGHAVGRGREVVHFFRRWSEAPDANDPSGPSVDSRVPFLPGRGGGSRHARS